VHYFHNWRYYLNMDTFEIGKLRRCIKCGLPETYETIEYTKEGLCNICKSAEFKKENIDWDERKKILDKLISKHRGKYEYDCIIPFSGGKDSTFTLLYLVEEYGIKPLVVRFNHNFYRKTIAANNEKTFKKLGVDVIEFTPNWKIVKKLMKESFIRKGDFCWHCHTGIYSYPLRIALMYKTPLVFWGEPQSEITAYYDYENDDIEWEDEKKFNMLRTLGIRSNDMYNMINSEKDPVDIRDLTPYTFPDEKELIDLGYCSVPLGSFIPWDYKANTRMIKEKLNWEIDEVEGVPASINDHGEKIECYMQGTRDYIKYLKRGYGRVRQIEAFEVRRDNISPEDAHLLSEKFDGRKPHSLEIFLEYIGISEEEFEEILKPLVISPAVELFKSQTYSEKTWDFESWYRENK
jgi:N-acetyl sugar amidotransferase